MTDDQKDMLIEKMLDRPESLTDRDIEQITGDAELRELYETAVEMRNALAEPAEVDMPKEWRGFVKRLLKHGRWTFKKVFRVAAIIAGLLFVAGSDANDLDINL